MPVLPAPIKQRQEYPNWRPIKRMKNPRALTTGAPASLKLEFVSFSWESWCQMLRSGFGVQGRQNPAALGTAR